MQRIFTLAAFLLLTMGAKAQTYSYLTFQHTDGTQKSLTANGLKITFSGNTLTATSMEGTTTLALTDLSRCSSPPKFLVFSIPQMGKRSSR